MACSSTIPASLPVFEAARYTLNVPIYLHPAPPPEPVESRLFLRPARRGRPYAFHRRLGMAYRNRPAHPSTYPGPASSIACLLLQLIIGHMGERPVLTRSPVPSGILSQAGARIFRPASRSLLPIQDIHITTSGYFTQPPLRCAIDVVGIDRLLFSVDYPFSANTRGRAFLDSVPKMLNPG